MTDSQYMSSKEFKAIMAENGWHMSQAVRVYLVKASHCFKRRKLMAKAVKAHPENRPLQAEYSHLDESRVEYVWLALDTAKEEFLQSWRYLEDGSDFISAMMVKYEGDLSRCNPLEKAKASYIEILEEMQQTQIKNR